MFGIKERTDLDQIEKEIRQESLAREIKEVSGANLERELQIGKKNALALFKTGYLPQDFYGYPLMENILNKTFVCRSTSDFKEYIAPQLQKNSTQQKIAEEINKRLEKILSEKTKTPYNDKDGEDDKDDTNKTSSNLSAPEEEEMQFPMEEEEELLIINFFFFFCSYN